MRNALVLAALIALPLTAAADPAPGRYKLTVNSDYTGWLWLAPSNGVLCGYYAGKDVGPGTVTLKADGAKVDGIWQEGSKQGKTSFQLKGKTLDGSYTENMDDPASSPWVAVFDGVTKAKILPTYDLDWGGGTEKTTVRFKQKGNQVTGTIVYRYSESAGGTMSGTLSGDILAGTWKSKADDGTAQEGRFVVVFQKSLGSKTFDSVRGMYSSTTETCGDGGTLEGSAAK
jgi:hypothetical protein